MEQASRFCENCGNPLEEGASFCGACGVPVAGVVEIPLAAPARHRQQPPASPPPGRVSPPPPAAYYQPAQPPSAGYYQPAQRPPPPPAAYYQPPPSPGYYPPLPPPRRKTYTWLIVGGVVVALMVCCGLAALVSLLVGGVSILNQIPDLSQNQPPAIVDKPTLTRDPTPNKPQVPPVLPAQQDLRMEFTDDLMTNENQWSTFGGDTSPRRGFLISDYFIETTKEIGELRAFIPKIDNDQNKVRDFEIEFDRLQFSGDGFLRLYLHYVDDQNYYQLAIKDRSFLIRKKIDGQFINLTHGPWVRSKSIWVTGPNHIKVI